MNASDLSAVEAALVKALAIVRAARRTECPVHGSEALFAACPDCCASAGLPAPDNVIPLSKSLERSTRVTELAKELGVEPAAALKIARVAMGGGR